MHAQLHNQTPKHTKLTEKRRTGDLENPKLKKRNNLRNQNPERRIK